MDLNKFTQKSLQAVQDCQKLAYQYGNQKIEQEHLLLSLLTQEDSLIDRLLAKMGINHEGFKVQATKLVEKLVKVSGGQVYVGDNLNRTLVRAEEEAKQIDVCVRLSGLTKQDYIVRRLMCRDIVVQGNPRVYKALKNQMAELYEELKRIEQFSEENEELLYTLQLVAETLNGMKEDED